MEEERELTATYENILRAISMDNYFPKDVGSYLGKPSQDIKTYLKYLCDMGLVKKIKIFGKRRWLYKNVSPLVDLFYFLDSKYGFSELETRKEIIKREIEKRTGIYFEDFVREVFAEKYNGFEEKLLEPEIDGIITINKKPVLCLEIKLGKISEYDKKQFLKKTEFLKCKKIIVNLKILAEVL